MSELLKETWYVSNVGLDGEVYLAQTEFSGRLVCTLWTKYDKEQGNARAKLAAQAPAMARLLLKVREDVLDSGRNDNVGEIEAVLKDAGVSPFPDDRGLKSQ